MKFHYLCYKMGEIYSYCISLTRSQPSVAVTFNDGGVWFQVPERTAEDVDCQLLAVPISCSCPVCSAEFTTQKQLADHMSRLADDDTCYTCKICDSKFCNSHVLVEHKCLRPVSHVHSHTCLVSGNVSRSVASFRRHCVTHNGEHPYNSDKCPKVFTSKSGVDHYKYCHPLRQNYHCQNCDQEFSDWDKMIEHIEKKHTCSNEMLTCSICSRSWLSGREFLIHYQACHMAKETKNIARHSNVTCSVCYKVFPQPSALSRHLKLHNLLSRHHMCEFCGEVITRRDRVLIHARKHYGNELPESYKKLERLSECQRRYRGSVTHRSFICEYCGREFSKKLNLQLHVRRHTGERPYGCQLCGKAFYTNQQLAIHVRRHTGERPYACGICSKAFTGPTALYVHRKLHDKVKRHLCPHCGKRFFWKSAFIGHVRLHTGERPYHCTICNKAFTLKGKLNLHMKKHAISACSDCGENFGSEAELNAHRDEQCCVTMVSFVEESPSGEKDTCIILVNTDALERNNISIDNSEVVQLVV